jgi:hypothetical protein
MTMALHDLTFEFIDISTCQRSWNFGPRQKLSEILPAWAVDGFLISGFDLESPHPVQNVTGANPAQAAELVFSLYPRLSWPEIVRLQHRPAIQEKIDINLLLSQYGTKWDDHWQKTSDFLIQWPGPVQDFISEKDVRAVDVRVLEPLPVELQKDILDLLVVLKPSKTQFCQMLEMAAELLLMETPAEAIMELLKRPNPLENLRQLRFPMTTEADLKLKEQVQKWPWPKSIAASAQRRGDVQGVEIKFFVKNVSEFEKILSGLQNVCSAWKSKDESDRTL